MSVVGRSQSSCGETNTNHASRTEQRPQPSHKHTPAHTDTPDTLVTFVCEMVGSLLRYRPEVSAEEGTVITIAVTDPGARIVGEAVAVGGDYQVPGEARGGLADGRAEGVVQGGDLCGVLAESSGRAAIAVRVEFAEGCGGWSGRGRGRNGSGRRGGGSPDEQE